MTTDERQQVREAIATVIRDATIFCPYDRDNECQQLADQILNLPGIEIRDQNQTLPNMAECYCDDQCMSPEQRLMNSSYRAGFKSAVADMLKAGWVKCLKKGQKP